MINTIIDDVNFRQKITFFHNYMNSFTLTFEDRTQISVVQDEDTRAYSIHFRVREGEEYTTVASDLNKNETIEYLKNNY